MSKTEYCLSQPVTVPQSVPVAESVPEPTFEEANESPHSKKIKM